MAEPNRLMRNDIPSSLGDALYQTGRNALMYPFRNPEQTAELGLSLAPGSGEAMSARDAWDASGRGGNALLAGNYGEAASNYGNMLLGIAGAIPGAGIIARGTKRGAAWMDRNLPGGVNRLLDGITPQNMQDVAPAFPAWHGSPHDYPAERLVKKPDGSLDYLVGSPDRLPDVPHGHEAVQDFPLGRVRLDKIGTGEGAQAYGHGWYAAENPEVARSYQSQLSPLKVNGAPIDESTIAGKYARAKSEGRLDELVSNKRASVDQLVQARAKLDAGRQPNTAKSLDDMIRNARQDMLHLDEAAKSDVTGGGRLYHTEIDAEPHQLLDWDKPLSEQSPEVMAALKKVEWVPQNLAEWKPGEYLNRLRIELARKAGESPALARRNNDSAYAGAATVESQMLHASRALREAGIPGIKYLDQGSRGAGSGSSNYVIFDDKLVKIKSKE